ncbi:MAG TPA: hypothetical protein VH643_06655 [Gemmataceae bacterium]
MLEPAEKGRSWCSSGVCGEDVRGGDVAGASIQAHSRASGASGATGAGAGATGAREQFGPVQGACFLNGWTGGGVWSSAIGALTCTAVT